MKTGYSIRTWRMRLVCPEPIWLDRTEEYFQNVVEFYYHLLRQHEELWNSSLFDIQRSLELLTLTGRDGRQPTNPIPIGKVPVYLGRAAINCTSATVNSTQELQSGFPEKLEAKVTFFKGMYSDLTDRSICLKLWNGEKWIWTDCNLKGRPFPQDGQLMSPTLVKEGRRYLLNIPVKQENSDARTAKERMAEGTNLCSVRFTNTDTFAVCCILDEQGKQLAVHNCRGGDAYRHRCKLLETRIQKSRPNTVGDNKKAAPASMASTASSYVRTVPAPTMICAPNSWLIFRMDSRAPGVFMVISTEPKQVPTRFLTTVRVCE